MSIYREESLQYKQYIALQQCTVVYFIVLNSTVLCVAVQRSSVWYIL